MSLNNNKYKDFCFGSLISEIYKAKAINKNDLEVANNKSASICYITRTGVNNGCEMFADISGINKEYIEKGNAITIGDTTATCFYQDKQFIAGDHMVVIRADWLNKYTGLYIVTLLNKEQYKYSYGRAFVKDKIKNTILKLPANNFGEPDREFMENYIKSLHYKPITTQNHQRKYKLNTDSWKEFRLGDIFKQERGKESAPNQNSEGQTPIVNETDNNNGITRNVEPTKIFKGNAITISINVGYNVFYQPYDFCASVNISILKSKYLNKYNGLFIVSVIKENNKKYSYGYKTSKDKINNMLIKLPVDSSGNPDREFMENYIKNLPYGDRI